jgi:hypothetical protein
VAFSATYIPDYNWCLDIEAIYYIAYCQDYFQTYSPYYNPHQVHLGDDLSLNILGVGLISILLNNGTQHLIHQDEAILTAKYLRNCFPSKALRANTTPFEL